MTQLNEAIARYHRIIEAETHRDLGWVEELENAMNASYLTIAGRPVSPVLRPHFITPRQYAGLVKAAEAMYSAIDRVEKLALSTPALMARMQMLPAEKMLAAVDPGYPYLAVTSLLDSYINNGTLHFSGYTADTPMGVIFGDTLNQLFLRTPPMQEFQKKYSVAKMGGSTALVDSLARTYKEFGGKKSPNVAILEFRQPFQATKSGEYHLLTELFRREGYPTEIVSPDQLEYRNGILRKGDFEIDIIYRRVKVSEFLLRFDLNHPLVRAYRERAVCMVNSFRSELAQKRAIFDLLTDDQITSSFPAAERKAIADFIPWTRVVRIGKTTHKHEAVDFPDYIVNHQAELVLRPNDDGGDSPTFYGSTLDGAAWEKAIKEALRGSYVVQEEVKPFRSTFPLYRYGSVEMTEMSVDVQPHSFLGKVHGCSTWLTAGGTSGFSTIAGLAPTFVLESK